MQFAPGTFGVTSVVAGMIAAMHYRVEAVAPTLLIQQTAWTVVGAAVGDAFGAITGVLHQSSLPLGSVGPDAIPFVYVDGLFGDVPEDSHELPHAGAYDISLLIDVQTFEDTASVELHELRMAYQVVQVPEPSALLLGGVGAMCLIATRCARQRRSASYLKAAGHGNRLA